MSGGSVLQRLFSRATVVFLFVIVLGLLVASFYTYFQDRKLQSVSLGALRMASWNLAQLGNEASAFDREVALMARGVGDAEELQLRYDVLWSRYDYLINSKEALPTRRNQDNQERLTRLFRELRSLEVPISDRLAAHDADWASVESRWNTQKAAIQQLVVDNFVGDETGRLMADVEASRDRLANLRVLTLAALAAIFLYMGLAVMFLRKQSRTDPVTGLRNVNYLRSVKRIHAARAFITCEIREFSLVRTDYGNDGANELAALFANKLGKQLRTGDELIHLTQSEYVVILSARHGEKLCGTLERLARAASFDWRTRDSVVRVSAIFGADPGTDSGSEDWNVRYQQAHRALAQAELDGQSYFINDETLRRRIAEERQIHSGLVRFFNDEPTSLRLHLVYQPIVRADDRHLVTGAEVLLRCRDDSLGFVPPNRVVDICERFGLGGDLGRWLFRQVALETGPLYRNLGFRGNLSINLNPSMLTERLVEDVQTCLIDEGLPASALCLEITEDNAALEFAIINELIERLHGLGLEFALDDFGTGHSSLEYVRELQVDRLKIDRCFVDGIEDDPDKCRFLGSIIAMSEQAYMKSVIEGVENEAQWQLVEQLGGVLIQGYHAHRPMTFNDYMALLMTETTRYPTAVDRRTPVVELQ
ncbi:EAL domain-containing protein [Marinobacter santoriniensis]|uniref:EAL domain-containing protein n=1 Tax=Marinobacter santoriniensis TaxID=523742 RepID=UPI00034B7A35|nr:GGDEF domain-containing phosphodiesterase [Marinobacter santoriniensis]